MLRLHRATGRIEHLKITLKRSGKIMDTVNDAVTVAQRKKFPVHFLDFHSTDDRCLFG